MLKIISGIAEGQVLQRGKDGFALAELDGVCDSVGEVAIWIETQQGQPISGRLVVPVEQGKKFRAVLKGIPVGGPYEVCLAAGSENLRLKAVYVGDVWLLGGQSNMEGCGRMDVPDPADLRVRAFSMDREWRVAQEPLHVLASSPDPVHYCCAAE